jgi:general secretion pathway protein K
MRRQRGIALVNALVMVAAVSAVAAALMLDAAQSRQRIAALRDGDQAELNLDAAEHLAPLALERDWEEDPDIDHRGEPWAVEGYAAPIEGGVARGRIVDLQGRFNLNWLADPADIPARQAFERLLRNLGLPVALGRRVSEYMAPGGPSNPAAYAEGFPPLRPAGGPLRMADELRLVEGLSAADHRRLAPHVAALPGVVRLNANTATPEVLAAMLPAAGAAALERLLEARRETPFESAADFRERAERLVHAGVLDAAGSGRFGVGSRWFEAELEASAGEALRTRRVVLARSASDGEVSVAYRLPGLP